jgi:PhnB protein
MPVKAIPDGYPRICPYLMVANAEGFTDFMTTVLGGRVIETLTHEDGRIRHREVKLGDSVVMFSEATAERPATPVTLYVYVEDVDEVFERAVQAGGRVVAAPAQQMYGDRSGGVIEPSGNTIWLATHVEDVSPEEYQRRAANL